MIKLIKRRDEFVANCRLQNSGKEITACIYTYTYIPTLYITFPFQSTGENLSHTLSVLASG